LCFRSIQPKQEAIVDDGRIVDSVRIYDDSADHPAEFDQMMPIATVASESRCLNAENGANFARAHFSYQALKSGPVDQAGAGAPEVVIDD
jgi:hypothetical protein